MGVETRWSIRSFQPKPFCDSKFLVSVERSLTVIVYCQWWVKDPSRVHIPVSKTRGVFPFCVGTNTGLYRLPVDHAMAWGPVPITCPFSLNGQMEPWLWGCLADWPKAVVNFEGFATALPSCLLWLLIECFPQRSCDCFVSHNTCEWDWQRAILSLPGNLQPAGNMPKAPVQPARPCREPGMHALSLQASRDSLLQPAWASGDLFPSTTVFSFTGSAQECTSRLHRGQNPNIVSPMYVAMVREVSCWQFSVQIC